ncbi:MAG: hemerythrin domain-containing protein [Byssovorax sp.]
MEYDRMLAELFGEEDRAREMATRLAELAKRSRESAAAEKDSLIAFIRGPMERHFHYEETVLFPQLESRGLAAEVQVAAKQHDGLRQLADKLTSAGAGDDVRGMIFDIARLMLHHTNFEGDYIYPELTHADWRELMKETVALKQTANP